MTILGRLQLEIADPALVKLAERYVSEIGPLGPMWESVVTNARGGQLPAALEQVGVLNARTQKLNDVVDQMNSECREARL